MFKKLNTLVDINKFRSTHIHEAILIGDIDDPASILLHVHGDKTDWLRRPFAELASKFGFEITEKTTVGVVKKGSEDRLLRAGWAASDPHKSMSANCHGRTKDIVEIFREGEPTSGAGVEDGAELVPVYRVVLISTHSHRFRLPG